MSAVACSCSYRPLAVGVVVLVSYIKASHPGEAGRWVAAISAAVAWENTEGEDSGAMSGSASAARIVSSSGSGSASAGTRLFRVFFAHHALPRGWRGKDAYEISGRVMDANGRVSYEISGCSLNSPVEGSPFNLTPFAITLNDCPKGTLKPYLCPTDCRLRPDQRAFEMGKYEIANGLKNEQEEKQRADAQAERAGRAPAAQAAVIHGRDGWGHWGACVDAVAAGRWVNGVLGGT
ncbi:hypothetical protein B0H14DRAFT_3881255 [Mycena olivaceomarginata]|nr:hypothetical protein B0H14DRAFT_3881255 [Mycena olivaceomarginata]